MHPFAAPLCLLSALLVGTAPARAETMDQVRRDFARMIYEDAAPDINHEAPQPLLRAVVVLRVRLDAHDRWTAEVMRENDVEPGLTRKAIASVEHLARSMVVSAAMSEQLRREGFVEVWLFQNDGRFALKTLALPQRGL
jgi:protein TonB